MKQLIERFMAGETTCDEERRLFEAFEPGRHVDPEFESLRPMMQWYASLADAGSEETASAGHSDAAVASRRRFGLRPFAAWASAAASVVVAVAVGYSYMNHQRHVENLYAEYHGSYVVRDGVKITDIPSILPELERAEREVERRQREIDRRINAGLDNELPTPDELEVSADPEVNRLVQEFFSEQE